MKDKKRNAAGLLLAAAAAVCAVLAIMGWRESKSAGNEPLSLPAVSEASSSEPASNVGFTASLPGNSDSAEEIPIDFDALRETCPDAYAWIRIDGTNVDYPIVQSSDDQSYYLTHSAEQEKSAAGAIYTENLNSRDFTDPVTVIYGHNMKNGSMFRTLHNFEDRAFFNEHREILIYLPENVLHFRIFAAYNTDDRHLLKSYDFNNKSGYQRYLNFVSEQKSMNAFVADDVEVKTDDRIVILSTCNAVSDERYLVQAVEED